MSSPVEEAGQVLGEVAVKRLCVLKFGSSVLEHEHDYPKVVEEIYRHVRDGEKVVAVVSALAGETDRLLEQARRVGGEAAPAALVARVARVGELHSAALMALALSKAGLARVRRSIRTKWDWSPKGRRSIPIWLRRCRSRVGRIRVQTMWSCSRALSPIMPSTASSRSDAGGTDLSAVFFADRLDAHRVRLIKDVDGVYDEDPAQEPAGAERYSHAQLR